MSDKAEKLFNAMNKIDDGLIGSALDCDGPGKLNNAITNIDDDIIEAALDATPETVKAAPVTAFTNKPWLKWAAAAAVFVIVAAAPFAMYKLGVFRSDNLVAPSSDSGSSSSEEDAPSVVTPIEDSGSDVGESDSGSVPDLGSESTSNSGEKPTNTAPSEFSSGESQVNNTEQGGLSHEMPTDPGFDQSSQPVLGGDFTGGSFVKDDMPPVTYLINGEYKTFSYMDSNYIALGNGQDINGDEGCIVIDRYIDEEGDSAVSRSADSGELVSYGAHAFHTEGFRSVLQSEEEIVETARLTVLNTDIPLSGIETASASIRVVDDKYYVTLTVPEGQVEVCIDNRGGLIDFIVMNDASAGLSPERIAAAKDKMNAKLEELNNNGTKARYVLNGLRYERWGSLIYAVFNVTCYPDKDSDVHSEYDYYCIV